MRLRQQVAIVTGGSQGIGRAIVRAFESSYITGQCIVVDGGHLINGYRLYGIERPQP